MYNQKGIIKIKLEKIKALTIWIPVKVYILKTS